VKTLGFRGTVLNIRIVAGDVSVVDEDVGGGGGGLRRLRATLLCGCYVAVWVLRCCVGATLLCGCYVAVWVLRCCVGEDCAVGSWWGQRTLSGYQ